MRAPAAVDGDVLSTLGAVMALPLVTGYVLEVLVVVSEVVDTLRVSVFPVGAGDSVVTPSSSTVSVSPAVTVLPAVIVQTSTVWELTPQVPTWVLVVVSVTMALTIVVVLKGVVAVAGKVIVIWLCAVPDIPPVLEVLNVIT